MGLMTHCEWLIVCRKWFHRLTLRLQGYMTWYSRRLLCPINRYNRQSVYLWCYTRLMEWLSLWWHTGAQRWRAFVFVKCLQDISRHGVVKRIASSLQRSCRLLSQMWQCIGSCEIPNTCIDCTAFADWYNYRMFHITISREFVGKT